MNRSIAALALAVALTACATVAQKRADSAFERGDYISAAELYDSAVREKPDNATLRDKRWAARAKAVEEIGLHASSLRRAGKQQAALRMARASVEARKKWFSAADASRLSTDVHAQVDELATWAVQTVSGGVRAELAAQKPLAAHAATEQSRGLFIAAGLESRFQALTDEVNSAGDARCAELKGKLPEGSAHLTHWVAAYCRVFSAEPPAVPPAPDQVGLLKIQADTLAPTSPEQRKQLEQRLEKLLIASSWFHQNAQAMASVSISGVHDVAYSQHKQPRAAHWIERVPYQAQESYQQPYSATEYYSAQESYTTYRQESYSCGYGTTSRTCSRSSPQTQYRSVQKSRMVTKYRTQYRMVTRYREEPRIFNYEAIEHRGEYSAAWEIALTLSSSAPPLVMKVQGQRSAKDDEHNVTFVPAAVAPTRARLMSHEEWFSDRLKTLESSFTEAAQQHWAGTYCGTDAITDEQAARCARGAFAATPIAQKTVLTAFLRDDAELLLAGRLGRS